MEHQRTALKSRTIASHTAPEWGNLLLGAAIILLATFAVYWPAVHAGFIWDDDDILTANPVVSAPDGLWLIWAGGKFYDYWPMTLTSFWCEWRLWGLNAMGYHVTNILLHAAAAILFWRVLRHLRIPAAWLAALIFAIHPINVQSVAWITERKNTLSLFFFGVALLAYLRAESQGAESKVQSPRPKGQTRGRCGPGTRNAQYATRLTFHASRFTLLRPVAAAVRAGAVEQDFRGGGCRWCCCCASGGCAAQAVSRLRGGMCGARYHSSPWRWAWRW